MQASKEARTQTANLKENPLTPTALQLNCWGSKGHPLKERGCNHVQEGRAGRLQHGKEKAFKIEACSGDIAPWGIPENYTKSSQATWHTFHFVLERKEQTQKIRHFCP